MEENKEKEKTIAQIQRSQIPEPFLPIEQRKKCHAQQPHLIAGQQIGKIAILDAEQFFQ